MTPLFHYFSKNSIVIIILLYQLFTLMLICIGYKTEILFIEISDFVFNMGVYLRMCMQNFKIVGQ